MYYKAASSHEPRNYDARGVSMNSIDINEPASGAIVAQPFPVQEQCKANAATNRGRRA